MKYHVKNEGIRRKFWWDRETSELSEKIIRGMIIHFWHEPWEDFFTVDITYKGKWYSPYRWFNIYDWDEALRAVKEAMKNERD